MLKRELQAEYTNMVESDKKTMQRISGTSLRPFTDHHSGKNAAKQESQNSKRMYGTSRRRCPRAPAVLTIPIVQPIVNRVKAHAPHLIFRRGVGGHVPLHRSAALVPVVLPTRLGIRALAPIIVQAALHVLASLRFWRFNRRADLIVAYLWPMSA
jgi:hypothetical protein